MEKRNSFKDEVVHSEKNLQLRPETRYNIAFFGGLGWMMFAGPIIFTIGFLITVGISHPHLYTAIIEAFTKGPMTHTANDSLFIADTISRVLLTLFLIFILRKSLVRDAVDLKENWRKYVGYIFMAILAAIALGILVNAFYSLLGVSDDPQNQQTIEALLKGPTAVITVIAIILIAPILEELIFRKGLFGVIIHRFNGSVNMAIFLSTLIFALIHVAVAQDFYLILMYVPVALPLTFLYGKTNNIYLPMIVHFINNFMAFLGLVLS